jgi:hypothetical protein
MNEEGGRGREEREGRGARVRRGVARGAGAWEERKGGLNRAGEGEDGVGGSGGWNQKM